MTTWVDMLRTEDGSTTSALLVSIGGLSTAIPTPASEAQHSENGDDDLVPPHQLQGPAQVQRLVAHPASE